MTTYLVVNAEKGIVAKEYPCHPRSFFEEAKHQKGCALCGKVKRPFEAHHVIKKQRIIRIGRNPYDGRLALRLCEGVGTSRCHADHEKGKRKVETANLPDHAICVIWDYLGEAGQNLLERDYSGIDGRWKMHLKHRCPICQDPQDGEVLR